MEREDDKFTPVSDTSEIADVSCDEMSDDIEAVSPDKLSFESDGKDQSIKNDQIPDSVPSYPKASREAQIVDDASYSERDNFNPDAGSYSDYTTSVADNDNNNLDENFNEPEINANLNLAGTTAADTTSGNGGTISSALMSRLGQVIADLRDVPQDLPDTPQDVSSSFHGLSVAEKTDSTPISNRRTPSSFGGEPISPIPLHNYDPLSSTAVQSGDSPTVDSIKAHFLSLREEYNRQRSKSGSQNVSTGDDESRLLNDDSENATDSQDQTTNWQNNTSFQNDDSLYITARQDMSTFNETEAVSDDDDDDDDEEINDGMSDVSTASSIKDDVTAENDSSGSPSSRDGFVKQVSLPMPDDVENISDEDDDDGNDVSGGTLDEQQRDDFQSRKNGDTAAESVGVKRLSGANEEQLELDYEEEDVEAGSADKDRKTTSDTGDVVEPVSDDEDEGEIKETEEVERSDEGEIDDDDDCEEGEIKEPGGRKQPVVNVCRFYLRGHCTWGPSCRYVHPGVNDKGNYQMIDHPMMGRGRGRPGPGPWPREPGPSNEPLPPLPPPPIPDEPAVESAWERGVRHSKEIMKAASERRETDPYFEEKRLTLSLDEEALNKDPDAARSQGGAYKDPYYDDIIEDRYYEKPPQPPHMSGPPLATPYEAYDHPLPPPHIPHPHWERGPDYPPSHMRGRPGYRIHHRGRAPHRAGAWVGQRPGHVSPPPNMERRSHRKHHHSRREKSRRHDSPSRRPDEWHDPWRRSKSPAGKHHGSGSRSRSRGRRRRSYSHSSYTSSSYSRSSRSWSSSRSSYSSYSRSSSSSRSKSRSPTHYPPPSGPVTDAPPPGPATAQVPHGNIRARPAPAGMGGPMIPGPASIPMPAVASSAPPVDAIPPTHQHVAAPTTQAPPKPEIPRGRGYYPQPPPPHTPREPTIVPPPVLRDEPVRYPQKRDPAVSQPPDTARKDPGPPVLKPVPSNQTPHPRGRRRRGSRSSSDSRSSSRSRSASSISSASRSSSSSSASADSNHLYRDMGSPAPAPSAQGRHDKKLKGPRTPAAPHRPNKDGPIPFPGDRGKVRPGAHEDTAHRDMLAHRAPPPSQAKLRDSAKAGQNKSGIRLTLLNKNRTTQPNEKNGIPGPMRKRGPQDHPHGPPPKRPMGVYPSKPPDSRMSRPLRLERPPLSPISRSKLPPSPVKTVRQPATKPTPPAARGPPKATVTAPSAPKPVKRSTTSRREELLKQLKAVEDAIARKRAKLS